MPEYAVGSRGVVFNVGLKDIFSTRTFAILDLVSVQTWVPQIVLHQAERLLNFSELSLIFCGKCP